MGVMVYSWGLVSLSACAPKGLPVEEVTRAVNTSHPTGIESKWEISDEKEFSGGQPLPCQCEADADKVHYLFHC